MSVDLLIVGASALDFDALAVVLEQHSAVRLVDATVRSLRGQPAQRVVDFHGSGEAWDPHRALELRAAGHDVLVVADFDSSDGRALQRHGLQHALRGHLRHIAAFAHGHDLAPYAGSRSTTPRLSPRETEVARLLLLDPPPSRAEMATALGMSPATVKVHLGRIRTKLGGVGTPHATLVRLITSSGAAD